MGMMQTEQTIAIIEAVGEAQTPPPKPNYAYQIFVGVAIVLISGWVIYVAKRIKKMNKTFLLLVCVLFLSGCAMTIEEIEGGCKLKGFGGGSGTIEGKCKVDKGLIPVPNIKINN